MRIFSFAAIAAITLGVTLAGSPSAAAQSAQTAPEHVKIFGYQDTQTGTFQPLAHAEPDTSAPSLGKYVVTFTIKIASTFPAKSVIDCRVGIVATSINMTTGTYVDYDEAATSDLTLALASPTTVTCKVTIPYSWALPAASTSVKNSVSGSYSVTVYSPSTTTIPVTSVEDSRTSSSTLPIPATVPAAGATTSATVNATL